MSAGRVVLRIFGNLQIPWKIIALSKPLRGQLPPDERLQFLQLFGERSLAFPGVHRARHLAGTGQGAVERVVVFGGNGIHLVVVTPGASHRQPLEGLGQGVDLVVDDIGSDLTEFDTVVMSHFGKPVKGRADQRLVHAFFGIDPGVFQKITRDLFTSQLIERNIDIEGPDQVIAKTPGTHDFVVPLKAVGFSESDHIHPVAGPVLTKVRRGQEPVHQFFVDPGGGCPGNPLNFPGLGRKSGQNEADAPRKSREIGSTSRGSGPPLQGRPAQICQPDSGTSDHS